MAAATVTRLQNDVDGRLRRVNASSIVFASNSDTWTVPGIKTIYSVSLIPTTNTAFTVTKAGNVLTLVSAGGLTLFGSVLGL